MRIGIIGTGKHGSRYAHHIVRDIPELELVAISRRSSERRNQASLWNCRAYADWRALVAADCVEAVISVVPPALNLDIVRACVAARKPLLVEKPLAVSRAKAREILSLCEAGGLPLTVAQTLRYNGIVHLLHNRLPGMGELYSFCLNQRLEPSTLTWHEQPELAGAGVSFHTAVHLFDALHYLTGLEVERVMAISGQQKNAVLEDILLVLVELKNGVRGTVDCSKVAPARSGRLEFVCSKGHLVGDQMYNTCEQIRHLERTTLDGGNPVNTIIPLLQDWLRYLRDEGENPVSGHDGFKAVAVCEACLRSAVSGQWVTVEEG